MDGESYHTLNPYALDLLPYAELNTIGKSLNLMGSNRGRISREVLIKRIIEFHRQRDSDGNTLIDTAGNEENIPMNVTGNNFAVFPVIVNPSPVSECKSRKSKYPKRESCDGNQKGVVVKADVSMLSALQVGDLATPSKGILKCNCDSPTSVDRTEYIGSSKITKLTPGKLEKITFSPFNAVKVIPHRVQASESKKEVSSIVSINPRKRILFSTDDDDEEEEEYNNTDNWGDEEEEEIDPDEEIEIYSDDETNDLVWQNTQRNSGVQIAENNSKANNSTAKTTSNNVWLNAYGYNNSDTTYLRSHEFFEL